MKTFAIASIIALASIASAQLDNIPSCALSCFIGPLSSDGCSALTDFKCHCQKGSQLLSSVQPCVQGACSAADQATTISAVQSTCDGVGVPINLPAPGGASSAASAASQAASSAAASSAAASSAAAPAVSSVVSAASSQAAAVSSAASAVSSLASRASTVVASASASANRTSTPASQFTGGAPQATKAAGLLGAAAIAMLAL